MLPVNYTSLNGWSSGSIHTLNVTTPQTPVTTNASYKFSTWSFGGTPTSAAQTITLPASSTTYTATFVPWYRGYSIVSPSCAANAPNPLVTDQQYADSSVVSFQVNPAAGWFFAGFSGSLTGTTNPQSLTVHDQFIVTANLNTVATPLAISSLSPVSLPQGSATQLVTITGTGFTASTIVFVNGQYSSARPVTFVDSQHLKVQVGPTDLTALGGIPIGVENFVGSCPVYVESSFLVSASGSVTPGSMTANANTTPQSAAINTAFANALAVTVRDAGSNPLSGVNVTFAAPVSGASGIFSNGTATITVATNASGVAAAPFTANSTAGGPYTVTAASTGLTSVNFSLTNTSTVVHSPSVVLLSPVTSTGASQVYTFQFADTAGAADLTVMNVLINNYLDGRQACYIAYVQQGNVLYLVNDAGDAGGPFAGSLVLSGSGSVGNSQCTINGVGSSAVASGNTLTLTLNMSFSTAFGGNKVVYLAARDTAFSNTGWQTLGAHGVPPLPATFPLPAGMNPSSGSTANPTLTFTFQDASAATNLQTGWALINTAIDGRVACYVAYYRPGNQIYLYPDNGDGTQATNIVLTGTNTISNSQCTISSQGSSVTTNGAQLIVNLNITFNHSFAGPKGVWMAAQTLGGAQTSAWQVMGAWRVP